MRTSSFPSLAACSRIAVVSTVLRASSLLALSILAAVAPLAQAAPIGVHVEVQDCAGTTQDGGYGSFSAAVSSNACGSASGSAGLSTGDLALHVTSGGTGFGGSGYDWLQDSLTFNGIPIGGSVHVTVTISGSWGGSFDWARNADFQVEYDLLLGDLSPTNPLSRGYGFSNLAGLTPSEGFSGSCGGAPFNCPGPGTTGPYFGEVGGTYSFSRTWQVFYFGGPSPRLDLFAALHAQAINGATGFIDHPITIAVDDPGVSFVAQSGNPYTVPEPDELAMLCTGVVALAFGRWRRWSGVVTDKRPDGRCCRPRCRSLRPSGRSH